MIKDAQQREEFMLTVLEEIASTWPEGADAPEEENYDDTESAYNNGEDCATYRLAMKALAAIKELRGY